MTRTPTAPPAATADLRGCRAALSLQRSQSWSTWLDSAGPVLQVSSWQRAATFAAVLIPVLVSGWLVERLARRHWLVPNLRPWQALWPTLGTEEESEEELTHGQLFTEFIFFFTYMTAFSTRS